MSKRLLVGFFMVLFFGCAVFSGLAKPPKAKLKHADKNKDGVVTKSEWQKEKEWEQDKKSNVNTWWEKKADTDADGKVSSSELSDWKASEKDKADLNDDGVVDSKEKRLSWQRSRSKVNTSEEKKYDQDGDGWLSTDEAKEMLSDRYTLIKTNGKAKVDSDIEAEYDADNDGIIDSDEAGQLKEDLGLD
ncbi:MAG: hypothetical protein JW734_09770 [Candidatus Omnitrophica bacterium]|nr:hypothetical protein [Candidatus Omnitrophota bacterium]